MLQGARVWQHPCRGRDGSGAAGIQALAYSVRGSRWPGGSNPMLPSTPQSWKWVLAPVILYIFERILRIWRARQKVVVTKVGGGVAA